MENRVLIRNSLRAADIRWMCGTEPPETAVLILCRGQKKLIVPEMEYHRIKRSVRRGVTVVYPQMLGSTPKAGPSDWIQKAIGKKSPLQVTGDFPLGLAEKLRSAGYKIKITEEAVCPQREVKTEAESDAVRQVQRAAVAAMKDAVRQIASARIGRNGALRIGTVQLTSEAVRAVIHRRLLELDCTASDTIAACGPLSADPHERGCGPLYAGQPIVIDIFPRSDRTGYWGDLTRTVCRGPAPDELKKMYRAVLAGQKAALRKIRAGVWTDEVHRAVEEEFSRRGYQTGRVGGIPQGFIHGTGHGVGLEIHEAPRVSSAVHKKLRAGNIITVEPGLYYPHIGGVRIEDTVQVTEQGVEMLAPCFKRLEVRSVLSNGEAFPDAL